MAKFYDDEHPVPDDPGKIDRKKLARSKKHPRPGLGKVRWRLAEFCIERGIVSNKGPKIGQANMRRVFDMTRVSKDILFYILRYPDTGSTAHFKTLARLCYGLQCQPGDLLEYVGAEQSDSPLSELYKLAPETGLTPETPQKEA